MGDFFSGIWDTVSGAAGDIWEGISGAAGSVWESVSDIFDSGAIDLSGIGDIPGFGGEISAVPPPFQGQAGPADVVMGGDDMNGDSFGGQMVQTGGLGAAIGAGALTLGTLLARTFGRSAAGVIFTAANGVRVRMSELWPLVRRYGPQAVAGGLGISAGALGTLLASPEATAKGTGRRGRGRGISASQLRTTRRTLKTIRKMYFMLPTRRASSARWSGRYRGRR